MTMRSIAVLSAVALVIAAPLNTRAQVDPGIHKLCVEAKDYAGCVRAMKGDTSPNEARVINSKGADVAEGNKCPAGFAYLGAGNCQEVQCEYTSSTAVRSLGHDSLIAGLKDNKGKDIWGCKHNFWVGAGRLRLTGAIVRSTMDPNCPPGEPRPGFNNTCQTEGKLATEGEPGWKDAINKQEKVNRGDQTVNSQPCSPRNALLAEC